MPKTTALPVIPKAKNLATRSSAEPVRKKAKVEQKVDKEPAGAPKIDKEPKIVNDAQLLIETAIKVSKDAEEILQDAYEVVQAMAKNLKNKQCAIAAQRSVLELEANVMLRDVGRD